MSAPLETMEQLEEMGVRELKEFLRRHGYLPHKIPRIDGSSGPPKKSDLLHAAQQILHQIKTSSTPVRAASENPFQRRVSTSDAALRLSLSSPHAGAGDPTLSTDSALAMPNNPRITHPTTTRPPTAPTRARPSTSTAIATATAVVVGAETPTVSSSAIPPSTAAPAPMDRRKSHTAINPNFSHLFKSSSPATPAKPASTPARPQGAQQPSRRLTIDPRLMRGSRILPSGADPVARRTTVAPTEMSPATAVAVEAAAAASAAIAAARFNASERPERQPSSALSAQVVPLAPAPVAAIEAQTAPRQVHTVPSLPSTAPMPHTSVTAPSEPDRHLNPSPPSNAQRAGGKPVGVKPSPVDKPPFAALDDDPPTLNDEPSVSEPLLEKMDETGGTAGKYLESDGVSDVDMPDAFDPVTSTDEGDRSDVTNETASDYGSSVGGDSDAGSTVETDDEVHGDTFTGWNASQLRSWLSSQGINFPPTNEVSELLPIARAHKMFLDTNVDSELAIPKPMSHSVSEQVSNRKDNRSEGAKQRRGRRQGRIIAPADDEDDQIAEVRPRPPKRRATRSEQRRSKRSPKVVTLRMRLLVAILSAMTGILLSSFVAAVIWLYQNGTRPYCESVVVLTKGVEDVALIQDPVVETVLNEVVSEHSSVNAARNDLRCIPCPKHGICRNGELTCMSGYIDVNGRCVEDEEFSVYAAALATEAYAVLSDVAGQAICGWRTSRYVRWNEVVEAVREGEINRPKRRFFQTRRPAYEEHKFDAAMVAARRRLVEDDIYDIEIQSNGELTSLEPTMTLRCKVKLFIWANLGRVLLTITSIVALIYLRVKIYFRRSYEKKIDRHYENVVEALRTHKELYENKMENYAFVKDVVLRTDEVGQATMKNILIWKDVEKKINADPRILRASRTVDGVPSYTYEWAGRRRSSSVGDGLSRRSSFGSRGSLDSLDFDDDLTNANVGTGRRSLSSFLGGWSDREG